MRIELNHLRQVVALAEHGSFVRAAAALHLSQPALSRSIQAVEARLGAPLFARTPGAVVPTDTGRLYVERARELLRMADDLEGVTRSQGSVTAGRVAAGAGPYPAEALLGPAAARLVTAHPQTTVRIHSQNWDELLRLLRARELDFFVAETSTLAREPDLEIERLGSPHSVHFFARSGHPLAGRRNVSAVEVTTWPFATPTRVPPRVLEPMLAAHRAAARGAGGARPFPAIECNGLATVKRVVANSDAISGSILACIGNELESGDFVLLGTEPWLYLQYGIVSLKGRPWTRSAATLRGYVLEAEAAVSATEAQLLAQHGSTPPATAPRRRRTAGKRARR
jgi:DNA-binding transcriptional LysR family regulator